MAKRRKTQATFLVWRDNRGRFVKKPRSGKATKKQRILTRKSRQVSSSQSSPSAPSRSPTRGGASFIGKRDQLNTGVVFNWWRIDVQSSVENRGILPREKRRQRLWFVSASDIAFACDAETKSKSNKRAKREVLVRGYANILFRDKNEQWTVCSPTLFAGDDDTPEELANEIAQFINKYQVQSVIEVNLAFEPIGNSANDKQKQTRKTSVKKIRGSGHRKLARRKGATRRH